MTLKSKIYLIKNYILKVYDQVAWQDHRKQTRYWNYASTTFG